MTRLEIKKEAGWTTSVLIYNSCACHRQCISNVQLLKRLMESSNDLESPANGLLNLPFFLKR